MLQKKMNALDRVYRIIPTQYLSLVYCCLFSVLLLSQAMVPCYAKDDNAVTAVASYSALNNAVNSLGDEVNYISHKAVTIGLAVELLFCIIYSITKRSWMQFFNMAGLFIAVDFSLILIAGMA